MVGWVSGCSRTIKGGGLAQGNGVAPITIQLAPTSLHATTFRHTHPHIHCKHQLTKETHLWTSKAPECCVAGDVCAAHVAAHTLVGELIHPIRMHQRAIHDGTAQVPAVACCTKTQKHDVKSTAKSNVASVERGWLSVCMRSCAAAAHRGTGSSCITGSHMTTTTNRVRERLLTTTQPTTQPTCVVVEVDVQGCDLAAAGEANLVLGQEGVPRACGE